MTLVNISRRSIIGLALCSFLASSMPQLVAFSATPPTYPTTSLRATAVTQANISGYQGALVNYSSSLSSTFSAFVYLEVADHAGHAVYINFATVKFVNGSFTNWVQGFVGITPPLPKGNYTALVFATTNSSIPLSTTTSLKLTL